MPPNLPAGYEYESGFSRNSSTGSVAVDAMNLGGVAQDTTVTKRFGGGKVLLATVVSGNGDNTIHTPASGKAITTYWVGLSSSTNNAVETLVSVKIGGTVVYQWYMGNPGAFAHWEPFVGNPNDALIVNLNPGGPSVAVNVTYTEA